MSKHLKNIFPKETLSAISAAIGKAENSTSGEIRVAVRQKRGWRERKYTIEDLARKEFRLLGMTNTKDRTGVLIFLLLEDKKFFILADEGIYAKIPSEKWVSIAKEMSGFFSGNDFRKGIILGVQAVGEILATFFPRKSDDKNELSDEVTVK